MKDLERHEALEMRVLDEMRQTRILDELVFGGGTMLRLCYDLPRYSVDFDFYLKKKAEAFHPWVRKLNDKFRTMGAEITDQWEKHFSFLWEIRMEGTPRRLKIEIRKDSARAAQTSLAIAHSPHSPLQVRLRVVALEQMWLNKVDALASRREIRDAYDLEFLTLRGPADFAHVDPARLRELLKVIDSFSKKDFQITLGSVLSKEERERVVLGGFEYLKTKIRGALTQ